MNERRETRAALTQVLEDAQGCRAVVASMLLLDLPQDVVDELAACDEQLTLLIVTLRSHLGGDRGVDREQDVA
jgi:hypothetical protein